VFKWLYLVKGCCKNFIVVLAGFGIQAGCCFEVIVKTGLIACYFIHLKTRQQSKAKRIEEYKMKCFTLSLIPYKK
jgi:hypothetical protein